MRKPRAERGRGSALRWILLAAVAVALIVAARVLPVGEWLRAFEGWVARQGAWGGVLYGLVYVVAGLLFVPAWLLTIGAGLIFGAVWGTIIVSLSSPACATARSRRGRKAG